MHKHNQSFGSKESSFDFITIRKGIVLCRLLKGKIPKDVNVVVRYSINLISIVLLNNGLAENIVL